MTHTYTDNRRPAAPGALNRRAFLGRAASLGVAATAAAGPFGAALAADPDGDRKLSLVALEEHFATPELIRLNGMEFLKGALRSNINDVGAGRIADMDAAGIGIQVLSALTPGAQNLPGAEGVAYARRLNSWVAREVIPAHPDRFRAFATLPLSEPQAAADELEYAVRDLGFVGCMTYGAVHGKFLDHADFAPVLARAETLGVPIYIHPNRASPEAMEVYYNGLGDRLVSFALSGPGYGWHQEVALQCLRMIVSGVFDRHPKLQIVVGHMGEGLPFFYWRFGGDLARVTADRLQKPVQQYFHDNFWITTSAFFRDELLRLVLSVMGEDRVMFAVDYPFVSNREGADWLRAADLPRSVKEKIAHRNAERLLGIGPF